MKKQLVSVIVTTRNEEKNIGRCLRSVKAQLYTPIELLVVDNHSSDGTVQESRKYTKNIFQKGPERSAQRNYGAKKAKGRYVLFLDADMQLSKKVVSECVEEITSKKNSGGIVIPEISVGTNFWEKTKAFERSFYNEKGDTTTDAARFFPLSVFNKVGGYDETITGPEDWDLPETIRKHGQSMRRITAPIYHYEHIPSLFSLAKKKFYYGLQSHRYLTKQKENMLSGKTLYFLRPVFYQYPQKYLSHPILSVGMIIMLTAELFAGGLGFILGKMKNV